MLVAVVFIHVCFSIVDLRPASIYFMLMSVMAIQHKTLLPGCHQVTDLVTNILKILVC